MATFIHDSDSVGVNQIAVALIGPHDQRRRGVAHALAGSEITMVREMAAYPSDPDAVQKLVEDRYEVVIIDLDSSPETALGLVEQLAANPAITIMVYSTQTNPELLVRCMRAGAREYLTQPIDMEALHAALLRASARRPMNRSVKKGGKVLVFLGGKGGSGVTTVACNFAVSLAQECQQNTILIDLDLPLGDAALNLGISPQFSTVDALQNAGRLDSNFFTRLLAKHSSGLSVLAAPGKFPTVAIDSESVERLIGVARQEFDFVVIDAGSRFDLSDASLLNQADTIYMVMQAGIPELRNSHRLITEYFKTTGSKLEIVLNRFMPRSVGVDEEHIAKALTRPVQWKIPSDYLTVRRMQNEATPLALEDSLISRAIREMARTACGMPVKAEKKRGFSFFGK